jgi:hypothetical protein
MPGDQPMQPTAKRNPARSQTTAARPDPAPDAPPEDIDRFRAMLARRLTMLISDQQKCWRRCKEPACRRRRACAAPHSQCSNELPGPPATPEQIERTKALLQRALRDRLAQLEAERGAGE